MHILQRRPIGLFSVYINHLWLTRIDKGNYKFDKSFLKNQRYTEEIII